MKKLILPLCAALALSGCTTDSLYTAGGAGIGGLAGNVLGEGDPLATGLGAASGALATEFVKGQVHNAKNASNREGYQLGRSDAVKQQYWILQSQQRDLAALREVPRRRTSLLPIVVGGGTNRLGVITTPTLHHIRVEETP